MRVLLALLVLLFELADLLELSFLLDLKDRLLRRFSQKHVKDGLHFPIKFEQIVVADLCDFVDASLFWHVLGRGRLGQEHVCLGLDVVLLRISAPLLREEVGKVDLNTSWGSRAQIIRLNL